MQPTDWLFASSQKPDRWQSLLKCISIELHQSKVHLIFNSLWNESMYNLTDLSMIAMERCSCVRMVCV